MSLPTADHSQTIRPVAALHQVKWPGWKIHRTGSSPGPVLPIAAYCFTSVIVWTENKNITISDRFICFILTVKRRWRPVFWGATTKKGRELFWGKSASGWPGWRIFWPRNDLAPLLRWRRHCIRLNPTLSYVAAYACLQLYSWNQIHII